VVVGWWEVNADTLAGSRFVVSPLAETFAALRLLHTGLARHPGERDWLAAHLPAHRARLAADPVTALLVRAGLGPEWTADFLTPTPRGGETFEEEVARVRDACPDAARGHVSRALRGAPLPAALDRDDLPARAAGLLTTVWAESVRPDWDRRRRILEADVVARTAQVGRDGWAAALNGLGPGKRWLGQNRLQVNAHAYPPREIAGARLSFVPVTPQRIGWVSWEEPERYAVVYPCSGALADPGARAVPEGLGTLLGTARARVLVLLDSPLSTSQLVALTGQGLGSVGRHLRVLRDARLVERRRAGRSVLYGRTGAGEVLVAAQQAGTRAPRRTRAGARDAIGRPQGVSIRGMTTVENSGSSTSSSVLDVEIGALQGGSADLSQYAGRAVLVVNVASKCGLTPQYEGLERLQERYAERGFTVLGVPCNQFLGQEPGSAEEIAEFCSATYGVTFPMTEKVEVNGEGRHPLYARLTEVADAEGHTGDIRWNFEKFLVGKDGTVVARFAPQTEPESAEVVSAVEGALG